jgi:hypothetical protein
MALTDDETREALSSLSGTARDYGLAWVLDQVEEKVALGKVTEKRLSPRRYQAALIEESAEVGRGTRDRGSTPATFVVSEEYSSREQLSILIDALLLAVPTLHDIGAYTLGNLQGDASMDFVIFAPEVPTRQPYLLEARAISERRDAGQQLRELLHELKRELRSAP